MSNMNSCCTFFWLIEKFDKVKKVSTPLLKVSWNSTATRMSTAVGHVFVLVVCGAISSIGNFAVGSRRQRVITIEVGRKRLINLRGHTRS